MGHYFLDTQYIKLVTTSWTHSINVRKTLHTFRAGFSLSQSYYFCLSFVYENTVGVKSMVADPGGVDPDPDLTVEKLLEPELTLKNKPNPDPTCFC